MKGRGVPEVSRCWEVTPVGLSLWDLGTDWRSQACMGPQMSLRDDIQDLGGKAGATRREVRVARVSGNGCRLWVSALP